MSTPLQRINKLLPCLLGKDVEIAKRLIEKRDFEGLKDLTWSSLILVEKNLNKVPIPKKYENITPDRVDNIRSLAIECYDYYNLLYPEEVVEAVEEEATDLVDDY